MVVPVSEPGKVITLPVASIKTIVKLDAVFVPSLSFVTSLITLIDAGAAPHSPKVSPWAKWAPTADAPTWRVWRLSGFPGGIWQIKIFGSGAALADWDKLVIKEIEITQITNNNNILFSTTLSPKKLLIWGVLRIIRCQKLLLQLVFDLNINGNKKQLKFSKR